MLHFINKLLTLFSPNVTAFIVFLVALILITSIIRILPIQNPIYRAARWFVLLILPICFALGTRYYLSKMSLGDISYTTQQFAPKETADAQHAVNTATTTSQNWVDDTTSFLKSVPEKFDNMMNWFNNLGTWFSTDQQVQNQAQPTQNLATPETIQGTDVMVYDGNELHGRPLSRLNALKGYQMLNLPLDQLGRAVDGHILLSAKDMPKKAREPKITVNPVGWHNYKYTADGRTTWLFQRGHLIGYQFSGLNSVKENLTPMTAVLNAGKPKGIDDSNQSSMLYYENQLAKWLKEHPDYKLDYQVTPFYKESELLPRIVRLSWVGIDPTGKLVPISIGEQTEFHNETGLVYLPNTSPNATIDYQTGMAQVTSW